MSKHIVIRYSGDDPSQPLVRFIEQADSVQILVQGEEKDIVYSGCDFSTEKFKEHKGEEKERWFLSR